MSMNTSTPCSSSTIITSVLRRNIARANDFESNFVLLEETPSFLIFK